MKNIRKKFERANDGKKSQFNSELKRFWNYVLAQFIVISYYVIIK